MATRSLTKLIIINHVQPFTYASFLQPLCPVLVFPLSTSLAFPAFCLSPAHCLLLGQQEEQDEVINYTYNSSLVATHTHSRVSSFLLFHLVPSTGLCVSQKAVMTDERNRVSCPIKLGVYWGQTTGTHTQRQSSRPLLIRAEGLCLLAPYIRRHAAWRRLVASNSRGSHAMSGGFFTTGAHLQQ